MSNETDYLISLLMQNKAKKKMLDFVFENNSDADEKKMNAILDEKLRAVSYTHLTLPTKLEV